MSHMHNLDLDISHPLAVLTFLPDETLFSLCSRLHRVSCQALSRATCLMLFGHPSSGSQHDFPSRIGELVERTRGLFGASPRNLIIDRTLLRFFIAWRSVQVVDEAVALMSGSGIGALKMTLGLPSSRLRANHPLKFCPLCLRQDKATYGVGYWHLAHQYPGIWICLTHDCGLIESTVKSTGVGRFQWHLPSIREAYPPFDIQILGTTGKTRLRSLAESISEASSLPVECWRRLNTDHLCRLNIDQGLLLT